MEEQAEYQATRPELKIAKYDVNEAAISQMASIYLDLTIDGIEDKKGFDAVHSARMVMVRHRTGIDKLRKDANSSHQSIIKHNNADASRLIDLMAPIESHLEIEETGITRERERINRERERVERERIEGHRNKIATIQASALVPPTMNSESISTIMVALDSIDTSESAFEEFWTEATKTKDAALNALIIARSARVVWEKDEEERKAESERLARVSAEQEAERKRLAEIGQELEREIEEKREHFEKIHQDIEAEIVAQREAFEKEQAKFAAEKQAELDRKAAAEEAEQVAQAEAAMKEVNRLAKIEADKAETERQKALKSDKEKLLDFAVQLKVVLSYSPRLANLGDKEARRILQNALAAINDAINDIEEYTA